MRELRCWIRLFDLYLRGPSWCPHPLERALEKGRQNLTKSSIESSKWPFIKHQTVQPSFRYERMGNASRIESNGNGISKQAIRTSC
jgi:hypothetical protein